MADRLIHTRAGSLTPDMLGCTVMVRADETRTVIGGLSDYHHAEGRTWLYLGGQTVVVPSDAVVTTDLRGVTS